MTWRSDLSVGTCTGSTSFRVYPRGVVHIADRLLREVDGPMLLNGLQGFHGAAIAVPRRREDRPDPHRLESRFERFLRAAA